MSRRSDGRTIIPARYERVVDAVFAVVLFLCFVYLLFVLGPQFIELLHRDGVL